VFVEFIYADKYFDVNEFDVSPIKQVLKYEWHALNSFFKMGHVYTIKRHESTSRNSPLGLGEVEKYSFLQIIKGYDYMVEYNKNGYDPDYLSFIFLEDES